MSVPLWRRFLCNLQPFWHLLGFVAIIIIIVEALTRNCAVAYNVKQQQNQVKTASTQQSTTHHPPPIPFSVCATYTVATVTQCVLVVLVVMATTVSTLPVNVVLQRTISFHPQLTATWLYADRPSTTPPQPPLTSKKTNTRSFKTQNAISSLTLVLAILKNPVGRHSLAP